MSEKFKYSSPEQGFPLGSDLPLKVTNKYHLPAYNGTMVTILEKENCLYIGVAILKDVILWTDTYITYKEAVSTIQKAVINEIYRYKKDKSQ